MNVGMAWKRVSHMWDVFVWFEMCFIFQGHTTRVSVFFVWKRAWYDSVLHVSCNLVRNTMVIDDL
jgi:hypothetical protein